MEWLKNNLPLITGYLLVIGIIRLIIYYNFFNIDIMSYIDFSEIIQLQLKLYLVAFFGILLFAIYSIAQGEAPKTKAELEYKAPEKNEESKINEPQPNLGIESFPIILFVVFMITFISVAYCHYTKKYNIETNLMMACIPEFFFLTMFTYVINVLWGKEAYSKHSNEILFGVLLLNSIFICGLFSEAEAIKVFQGHSTLEVNATLENRIIKTNINYFYIGKNKAYLFFYDKINHKSEVIKYDDVKTINFSEGIDYSKLSTK